LHATCLTHHLFTAPSTTQTYTLSLHDALPISNTDLIRQARDPGGQLLRPWLLGAHHQTKGQGRGGKQWDNTPGTQLMFSCAFDVFLPSQQLPTLSPAMGIAACQAIRSLLPGFQAEQLSLKWPNDLM